MAGLGPWVTLYAAVALAQVLLQAAVGTGFWFVRARLDRRHPDDLPLVAGAFAEEVVRRLQIPVSVVATPSRKQGTDVFWPGGRAVMLSVATWAKRDPTGWAVAAHEVGHAVNYARSRAVGVVLESARPLWTGARTLAAMALLGNLAYASPMVGEVASALIAVGIAVAVVVLADELGASVVAMRLLRADGRLTPAQLASARGVLVAAFATYVAAVVGQGIALASVDALNALAVGRGAPPPAAEALSEPVLALAFVVAGACGCAALVAVAGKPPRDLAEAARRQRAGLCGHVFRGGLVLALLWASWDQPRGPWFPLLAILAASGARAALVVALSPALLVLSVALLVAAMPVIAVAVLAIPKDALRGEEPAAADRASAERDTSRLLEVHLAALRRPAWTARAAQVAEILAPVPFAVAVLAG